MSLLFVLYFYRVFRGGLVYDEPLLGLVTHRASQPVIGPTTNDNSYT